MGFRDQTEIWWPFWPSSDLLPAETLVGTLLLEGPRGMTVPPVTSVAERLHAVATG